MRILHLITRMDRGGSAVNTLMSAIEQQRVGHQVTLAYGPSLESDMSAAEHAKVDVDVLSFQALGGQIVILQSMLRSLGWHDVQAYGELKRLMQGSFDIIHTHTSKTGALGRLVASRVVSSNPSSRPRVIHTPHGHIFHGYFGTFKTRIFIAIERYLAKKTDALIALTHAEMNDHLDLKIGKPQQWWVIPSGVDVQGIRQRVEEEKQTQHEVWDAVSVGRLVPIKGMERLIAAWAKLCESKPDARLALVGDGEERERLEALVKHYHLEHQVYFATWADPIPYLAHARCFALLSHNEGMGRAVVEAFAAGLPCVVSNVCGLRELVNDSVGAVVDADDAAAVAKAIMDMWEQDKSEATWQRAQMYSLEAMIDGLEQVYQESELPR